MNLTAIIRLKEKVAVSSEFTPKERDFILDAINIAVDTTRRSVADEAIRALPKLRGKP